MRSPEQVGTDLRAAREAWELSVEELAARASVDEESVREAEAGRGAVGDLDELARALGGNLDELMLGRRFWEAPAVAFKSSPDVDNRWVVREVLARVSAAARTRAWLAELLGQSDVWRQTRETLSPVPLKSDIVEQAEELAGRVRAQLGNPIEPIVSMREVMRRLGVATFLAEFGTRRVDGMMWRESSGASRGPCVAANVQARKGKVTALRMTLAHELCHALFDGSREHPVGLVERRDTLRSEGLEQRANAFAIHLLAPRSAVASFLKQRGVVGRKPTARHVVEMSSYFGLGVLACAGHLVNLEYWRTEDIEANRGLSSPRLLGVGEVDATEVRLEGAAAKLPLELRGDVFELASTALSQGKITQGRWREVLGLHLLDDWRALLPEAVGSPGTVAGVEENVAKGRA